MNKTAHYYITCFIVIITNVHISKQRNHISDSQQSKTYTGCQVWVSTLNEKITKNVTVQGLKI
jgi:hypothetical protein